MSKNSTKAKPSEGTESERPSSAAAPVASTAASESTSSETAEQPIINSGAEARAAEISVAGKTKEKAPKKESFVINTALRDELFAMTNAALLERARDKLKPVELADSRVFVIDETHGLVDRIVGSDLSRSGIRSAVIDFLRSRDEQQAPGWAIASYMHLASGDSGVGVYKGNFDQGYLAARGRDVRRGMVSRGQLKFGDHDIAAPGVEAKTVETPQPPAEEPIADSAQVETHDELPIVSDVGEFPPRSEDAE